MITHISRFARGFYDFRSFCLLQIECVICSSSTTLSPILCEKKKNVDSVENDIFQAGNFLRFNHTKWAFNDMTRNCFDHTIDLFCQRKILKFPIWKIQFGREFSSCFRYTWLLCVCVCVYHIKVSLWCNRIKGEKGFSFQSSNDAPFTVIFILWFIRFYFTSFACGFENCQYDTFLYSADGNVLYSYSVILFVCFSLFAIYVLNDSREMEYVVVSFLTKKRLLGKWVTYFVVVRLLVVERSSFF